MTGHQPVQNDGERACVVRDLTGPSRRDLALSRSSRVRSASSEVRSKVDVRADSTAGPIMTQSDGCIVPMRPRTMLSDIGGGDGGGKAAGRGEGELQRMPRTQCRNRHVTEAASPRIGPVWVPNTPKADHVRPETGAGCGKAARPDLRGGRGAILVPTATDFDSARNTRRLALASYFVDSF
jgi:hypothetical protein